MTTTLTDAARALIDSPEFATVATVDPDGQPQLSLVWIGRDGDDVLFSTTKGRRKTNNLERDPRATLLIYPKDNPYSYLELRGRVSIVDDPKGEFIDAMAKKYINQDTYPWAQPGEQRVIVRLSPEHVVHRA